MNDFFLTLIERKDQLFAATYEHMAISLLALFIACVIAIPLAIWLSDHRKYAEPVLQFASILQTIPSLALLGLLIPLVGIGSVPALIALVVYAILPILQNTYTGFVEIDPTIEEAAIAFGMPRRRRLFKVELPIAMPVVISGIRTSLVLTIGTATLATLIGAGGLGSLIMLGIDRNDSNLTLIGAIASSLLAIIFGALIKWLENKKMKTILISLLVLFVGIGGPILAQRLTGQVTNVTIAGKLGSEPEILINMYKEIIEADNDDVNVDVKANFGKTTFLFSALDNNEIDIYPEFSGTVLESLVDVDEATDTSDFDQADTYQLARDLLKDQYDMNFLEPFSFENTYALAVKRSFAEENDLETISDLAKVENEITAGFTLEFIDRQDGYAGIQELYGLTFPSVKSLEPALRYNAINNNEVNVVDAYSTDSQILEYDLVTLEDDLGLFPDYQGGPLMNVDFAEDHPEIVASLNKLSGLVTEDEMIQMNYAVNVEGQEPSQVAHDFLVDKGLIGEDA